MTPFRLLDARDAAEAVALLRAYGPDAKPIAAGGDLLGLLKDGVAGPALRPPAVLVNLATAADLAGVTREAGAIRIGSMTTLAALASSPGVPAILAQAVARIASPQLRARTTVGGNLLQRPRCLYFRHPDVPCRKKGGVGCPAVGGPEEAYPGALFPDACHAGHPSDLAPALIALGARAQVLGASGPRSLPLEDLFASAGTDPAREAALAGDEILTCLSVPDRPVLQAFEKIAARAANEFAWASAAFVLDLDAGVIREARLALGGVSPGPYVCRDAAIGLTGRPVADVDPSAVAAAVVSRAVPGRPLARIAACRAAVERVIRRSVADGATATEVQ